MNTQAKLENHRMSGRRKLALGIFLLLAYAVRADDLADVTVRISELETDDGQILCTVFDSKETFLKTPLQSQTAAISKELTSHCQFTLARTGSYAVSIIHDANSNNELDTNLFGLPVEGIGTSNNPGSRFGPPEFKDAMFTLTDENGNGLQTMELRISMEYLF